MARQNSRRREAARIVTRAIKHKERRDEEAEALDGIKAEMIAEAEAAGINTIRKTHPATGEQLVVYRSRSGSPIDEAQLAELIGMIRPELADRLFPESRRRSADWDQIREFLAREQPTREQHAEIDDATVAQVVAALPADVANRLFPPLRRGRNWPEIERFLADEQPALRDIRRIAAEGISNAVYNPALAQRRIVEAMDQDSAWALRTGPPKRVFCVECATALIEPKAGIRLCDEHRKWYRIPSFLRAVERGISEADIDRFNDERRRAYRKGWLRQDCRDEWEANNTRAARARIKRAREVAEASQDLEADGDRRN